MDKIIEVTKKNYKDIFNSLNYTYIIVTYESEEVRIMFNKRIDIMNMYTGLWTVEEKKAIINNNINGEWVDIELDDTYQILYKNVRKPLHIMDESNYEIENLAIEAKENSTITSINNIEIPLIKYAKSMAIKYNVKFTGSGFNGSLKAVSVRKQIEEAFLNGKYNISFPSNDFGAQTIRNHASIYGSLIGRKLKVELSKGLITVHFKNINESNSLFINIKESYEKLCLLSDSKDIDLFFEKLLHNRFFHKKQQEVQISRDAIIPDFNEPFVYKLYGKPVSKDEYVSAANWQRLGFASQYNWENDIRGDVDMFPKDVRFESDNEHGYEVDEF